LQLPSHKYRHTVWHELRSTQVTGDQLHAPRVREGPESKEAEFYHLKDDRDGQLIHHSLKGKEKERYRNKQESWENSKVIPYPVISSHRLISIFASLGWN